MVTLDRSEERRYAKNFSYIHELVGDAQYHEQIAIQNIHAWSLFHNRQEVVNRDYVNETFRSFSGYMQMTF